MIQRIHHGMRDSAEYRIWSHMLARCRNRRDKGFRNYGARGIRVCDRWQSSFSAFFSDMGPRPSLQHSLERLDVNGNYEPANCVWATPSEQARNKRNSFYLTLNGTTMHAKDWAVRLDIPYGTLWSRKRLLGWSDAQVLTY